jgi:hypothetical protein
MGEQETKKEPGRATQIAVAFVSISFILSFLQDKLKLVIYVGSNHTILDFDEKLEWHRGRKDHLL